MPLANVLVLEGHPKPVLKQLVAEVANCYAEVMESPVDRVQVWITEVPTHLWAIGGVPADELLADQPRPEIEVPLIRLVAMDSRPVEQIQLAIERLSEVVARVLGGDPARVRVATQWAQADVWGIGGVPASIVRAADIAKRG